MGYKLAALALFLALTACCIDVCPFSTRLEFPYAE